MVMASNSSPGRSGSGGLPVPPRHSIASAYAEVSLIASHRWQQGSGRHGRHREAPTELCMTAQDLRPQNIKAPGYCMQPETKLLSLPTLHSHKPHSLNLSKRDLRRNVLHLSLTSLLHVLQISSLTVSSNLCQFKKKTGVVPLQNKDQLRLWFTSELKRKKILQNELHRNQRWPKLKFQSRSTTVLRHLEIKSRNESLPLITPSFPTDWARCLLAPQTLPFRLPWSESRPLSTKQLRGNPNEWPSG